MPTATPCWLPASSAACTGTPPSPAARLSAISIPLLHHARTGMPCSCPCCEERRLPSRASLAPGCLQAFQALVGGHKLSNAEELELVRSLDIPQQQVLNLCVLAARRSLALGCVPWARSTGRPLPSMPRQAVCASETPSYRSPWAQHARNQLGLLTRSEAQWLPRHACFGAAHAQLSSRPARSLCCHPGVAA